MEELKQVVVVAATNRPDRLDTALTRPGRLDRLIYIPPPDERSRLEILKINFKGKPLADGVDLTGVAGNTENYSGADLSALCYEASMSLIREADKGHTHITTEDISKAMEKVKSSLTSEELAYFDEMKAIYTRG
jgi:transitional endoplasmic reticulum ATPase